MNGPNLKTLQSWMISILSNPISLSEGVQHASSHYGLATENIIEKESIDRLKIYHNSYVLRLLQCLEADFPVLKNIMGEALFHFFATTYILNYPSHSTTLFDLGKGFSLFLEQTQSNRIEKDIYLKLPINVAKLERHKNEVFRAKGLEKIPHKVFVNDQDFTKIRVPPCLRIITLDFPLIHFFEKVHQGKESIDIPTPMPSYIAITRVNYKVSMYTLKRWQYDFLKIFQDTHNVEGTLLSVSQKHHIDLEDLRHHLESWLPTALLRGILYRI